MRKASIAFLGLGPIFLHFQFALIRGVPLTIGPILLICMAFCLFSQPASRGSLVGVLGACVFLLLVSTVPVDGVADYGRVLRTFVYIFLGLLVGARVLSSPSPTPRQLNLLNRWMFFSLTVICVVSLLQFALAQSGSYSLYNLWGSHQYIHEYVPNQMATPRAQGLFLEPSFDALVILSVSSFLIAARYKVFSTSIVAILGIIATQSASGLITVGIIAIVIGLRSKNVFATALSFISVWVVLLSAGSYLLIRAQSLSTQGSSANYRLIAPLSVLRHIVQDRPIGYPLGSITAVLPKYDLYNGLSIGTSLDNGYYVVIYYAGYAGIVALLYYVYAVVKAWRRASATDPLVGQSAILLLFVPVFTGGVVSPEFLFLVYLLVYITRVRTKSLETNVVGSNSDEEQRTRTARDAEELAGFA